MFVFVYERARRYEGRLNANPDQVRDFDVVGLEVFLSAFEKFNSGFWFNLKVFV